MRESGDGVSGTQAEPSAPERVHSVCRPQQEGPAAAERDPLGSEHVQGVSGEPEQQSVDAQTMQPGSVLLVTEPSQPCRCGAVPTPYETLEYLGIRSACA